VHAARPDRAVDALNRRSAKGLLAYGSRSGARIVSRGEKGNALQRRVILMNIKFSP
jgi:hypothetical protein